MSGMRAQQGDKNTIIVPMTNVWALLMGSWPTGRPATEHKGILEQVVMSQMFEESSLQIKI